MASIVAVTEAAIVEASLRASLITVATAAADKIPVLVTAPVDQTALATTTTSVAISPATHHPASLAASDLMRMQGIDKHS